MFLRLLNFFTSLSPAQKSNKAFGERDADTDTGELYFCLRGHQIIYNWIAGREHILVWGILVLIISKEIPVAYLYKSLHNGILVTQKYLSLG